MRFSTAWVTSTGESVFLRNPSTSSLARERAEIAHARSARAFASAFSRHSGQARL